MSDGVPTAQLEPLAKTETPAAARGRLRHYASKPHGFGGADAVIVLLEEYSAGDPEFVAEAYCMIARLHRSRARKAEALAAFRTAGIESSEVETPAWAPKEYVQLLNGTGQQLEATHYLLARLGAMPPEARPADLQSMLGRALVTTKLDVPDAADRIIDAIKADPSDRLIVEGYFDRVRDASSADEALEAVARIQDGSEEPIYSVLMSVSDHKTPGWTIDRFAPMLAKYAETPKATAYRAAWTAFLDGETMPQASRQVISGDRIRHDQLYFHYLDPRLVQLPLMRPRARDALVEKGVHVDELRVYVREFMSLPDGRWRDILETSPITEPSARETYMRSESECAFLDRIVEDGELKMMDPLTGEIVTATDSFIAFGRTLFAFRGKELFYLVSGKPWSAALGIYIPRLSLSIPFGSMPTSLLGDAIPNMLAEAIKREARHGFERTESTDEIVADGPRPVAMYVPPTENFAHHIWNFYSALERVIVRGLDSRLDKVIFSGTEFFGPLQELFPEIADRFERPRKNNITDPYPTPGSGLAIQSGGFFVSRTLTERIVRVMAARKKIVEGAIEPADVDLTGRGPVIWLAMRLRDKAWVGQEEGLSVIIRRLAARYPDAVFLLDGFSYPVGEDSASDTWKDVITALKAMAERIRDAASVPNLIVNMVGNSLRESVLWAQKTDVYLAPYGTTQHKIGWFTKAPGLVYVPPNFSPEIAARSPGASAVEYGPTPVFIFADAASAGERRGLNRTRERFTNVSLDADDMADQLIELLEQPRPAVTPIEAPAPVPEAAEIVPEAVDAEPPEVVGDGEVLDRAEALAALAALEAALSQDRLARDAIRRCAAIIRNSDDERAATPQQTDLSPVQAMAGLVSADGTATLGRNGFVYLTEGTNNVLSRYDRKRASSERLAEGWIELMDRRADRQKQAGRDFLQLVVPEKISAIPENLPFALRTPTDLLALIEEGMSRPERGYYLPVLPLFRAEAERSFYRLDSHQSAYGSYLVADAVARRLGSEALAGLAFDTPAVRTGDLAFRLLGVPLYETVNDPTIDPVDFLSATPERVSSHLPAQGHNGSRLVWRSDLAPIKRKAVVFGNSCFERGGKWRLSWWFSRLFAEFHFIWDIDVLDDYADSVGADIVIGQTMERFMFARMPTR